jgi:hypothetical protein
VDGPANAHVVGNNIGAGNSASGIAVGQTKATTGISLMNNSVNNVNNNKIGITLWNVTGADVAGNTTAAASGATTDKGIVLTANPNGTNSSTVTGNNVSASHTPMTCASGQGNNVVSNAGAADCSP